MGEGKLTTSLFVAFFAFAAARAEFLFWAKPADDTTLSWDILGAWKQVYSPWGFVNRLPTNEDTVTLNSAATSLAGEGIDAPHSLRITNGVAATALRVYIASSDATEDSSYAKSGRVVGVQIENGGSLDAYEVSVGFNAAGYGVLTLLGGTLKASHDLFIGNHGIGVLTNWNGSIRPYGGCQGITIAEQAGSKGTYVMLGGGVSLTESGGQRNLFVGKYGEGRAEIHTDITVPYLKIGGSTAVTRKRLFCAVMLAAVMVSINAHGFTVDADLPAGNIVVDGIDGNTVKVHQDLRDSDLWFYWAFRVKGAAGRTLTFAFTDKRWGGPVGVRGPVVSTDGGRTFSYPLDAGSGALGDRALSGGGARTDGFTYKFGPNDNDVMFYECHPYVRANWDAFVARMNGHAGRVTLPTNYQLPTTNYQLRH